RRVALLERNAQPGRKILISGGGRCNFTNLHCTPANFLSENPHFAKSALSLYQPRHFIELVERYGIRWHEKTLGQLFCDHSARAILDMLLAECALGSVELICDSGEIAIAAGARGGFRASSAKGEWQADALVVATGGLSIPKLGATAFAYDLARQFGLAVIPPRPALVPLVLGGDEAAFTGLAGVAAEVEAWTGSAAGQPRKHTRGETRTGTTRFREKMLITHRGLSGPAVLQASSYWRPGGAVQFDLATEREVFAVLREKNARRDAAGGQNALRDLMPARMAERWVQLATETPDWTNAGLDRMERAVHAWTVTPEGTEDFAKAEVTAGGVDTRELDARTMESRRVAGLYFIGEVVDVTGWLGGYNFQWAWASAVSAGRAAGWAGRVLYGEGGAHAGGEARGG